MMSATMPELLAANQFQRLRELLRLIAALRDISEPLTTPEGLRKAIAVLLELAVFLGLDQELVERIRSILTDERVFQLVLAVVGYLAGLLRLDGETGDGRFRLTALNGQGEFNVETRSFLEWLPFVLQLLELIRRLRLQG